MFQSLGFEMLAAFFSCEQSCKTMRTKTTEETIENIAKFLKDEDTYSVYEGSGLKGKGSELFLISNHAYLFKIPSV